MEIGEWLIARGVKEDTKVTPDMISKAIAVVAGSWPPTMKRYRKELFQWKILTDDSDGVHLRIRNLHEFG